MNNLKVFENNSAYVNTTIYREMLDSLDSIKPGDVFFSPWLQADANVVKNLMTGEHPIMIVRYNSYDHKALVVPITSSNKFNQTNYDIEDIGHTHEGRRKWLRVDEMQHLPLFIDGRFLFGIKLYSVEPQVLKRVRELINLYVAGELNEYDCTFDEGRRITYDQKIIQNVSKELLRHVQENLPKTLNVSVDLTSIDSKLDQLLKLIQSEKSSPVDNITDSEITTTSSPADHFIPRSECVTGKNYPPTRKQAIPHAKIRRDELTVDEYLRIKEMRISMPQKDIADKIKIPASTLSMLFRRFEKKHNEECSQIYYKPVSFDPLPKDHVYGKELTKHEYYWLSAWSILNTFKEISDVVNIPSHTLSRYYIAAKQKYPKPRIEMIVPPNLFVGEVEEQKVLSKEEYIKLKSQAEIYSVPIAAKQLGMTKDELHTQIRTLAEMYKNDVSNDDIKKAMNDEYELIIIMLNDNSLETISKDLNLSEYMLAKIIKELGKRFPNPENELNTFIQKKVAELSSIDDNKALKMFISDRCSMDKMSKTSINDLKRSYTEYCETNGFPKVNINTLSRSIMKLFPRIKKVPVDNETRRGLQGIAVL